MDMTTANTRLARILVATDGTPTGDRAVTYGIALARRFGSTLVFAHAVDEAAIAAECASAAGVLDFVTYTQTLKESGLAVLDQAREQAIIAGVRASIIALDGKPAEALVAHAHDRGFDAIVLGTQGKNGLERVFLGSTAEGVLRHTDLPTFVVPPHVDGTEPSFDRILLALDQTEPSNAAAQFARHLAHAANATLLLCTVADTTSVTSMAATYGYDPTPLESDLTARAASLLAPAVEMAHAENLTVETLIVEGNPPDQIVKTADDSGASLIVIGTHGRRGLRRFVVGSVAETVVRHSRVPVAVVHAATTPIIAEERIVAPGIAIAGAPS